MMDIALMYSMVWNDGTIQPEFSYNRRISVCGSLHSSVHMRKLRNTIEIQVLYSDSGAAVMVTSSKWQVFQHLATATIYEKFIF